MATADLTNRRFPPASTEPRTKESGPAAGNAPLPHGRGSVPSHDREGVVLGESTTSPVQGNRVEADILAVAAEEREFAGLLGRAEKKRRLIGWPVECAWLAMVGSVRWLLVADGPGASLAGRAAAEALSRSTVSCILSTGLCGALDDRLEPGQLVHAVNVVDGRGACWQPLAPDAGTKPVRLLSVSRVAVTTGEKRSLAVVTGAGVVEMEAAGVAAEAARHGWPFYCLRVVSDGMEEELPMDFNLYRDSEGRFSRIRIAAACVLRPWVVPALLRFEERCRWSAMILGDCLAHARFA